MSEGSIRRKAEDFLQVFRKGEEFTQELLKENERLRFRVAEIEEAARKAVDETRLAHYEERIRLMEEENRELRERISHVERENQDFASRYVEVEEENNSLANLYVASYQLHSTLDFDEVLKIVMEIVINLVGAEQFVVMLMDERSNELTGVVAEGMSIEGFPRFKVGEGLIGSVAREGESYFSEMSQEASEDPAKPIVCIPLKIKEHVLGVISIYKLLAQKEAFSNVDYELFNLLAGHAATAVFSAKLYTQSERKLTTIQSFLDLLKEQPRR